MLDFVDYHKRDISLPWGWTDLIQVLQANRGSSYAPPRETEPQEEYSSYEIIKPLSQIEKYISLVFESGVALSLQIVPFAGKKLEFTLQKLPFNDMRATVHVRMGTEVETRVGRFLETRGFSVPDSSVPAMFNPNLPVELFCDISPLPTDERQLAKLVGDLFHEVCGLNDQSELAFGYTKWGS